MDEVKLASTKLQSDPGTAALKVMDGAFTTHEMVNAYPCGITKSKDVARQKTFDHLTQLRCNILMVCL